MKILVADHDPVSRRLTEATLSAWGCQVIAVDDGAKAWRVLQEPDPPRLAFVDGAVPGIDALELCHRLRVRSSVPYVYLAMTTAHHSDERLRQAVDSGVDDYIVQPLDPVRMKLCVRTAARVLQLEEQLARTRAELRSEASRDSLTGIWNRPAIRAILLRELSRGRRESKPVGIVIADVDHLKQVNDVYGHLAGDEVLREIAQRMDDTIRPYDAVGRYGAEEFLFVFPGCDLEETNSSAERVRKAIACRPVVCQGERIPVTLSIGATCAYDTADSEVGLLLRLAHAAVFAAKTAGRDKVKTADPVTDRHGAIW